MTFPIDLPVGASEPAGLLDAFRDYERALMENDLAALDRLFAPGPDTLRGDAAGILRGHDAIGAFRRGRGGAPKREIERVEVRPITADAALVIAVTAPLTGGRGQQTQLWRRIDGAWAVEAAHVSLPAPAVNPTVWRVVGTPLVAGAEASGLASQTVAVKDLFAVAGHAIGGGVPAYLAEAPVETRHAPAVAALLATGASGSSPATGTAPWVVRSPQRPWYDAGTRTDPPVSVPRPIEAWPRATADAGPEDDPPGIPPTTAPFGGVP